MSIATGEQSLETADPDAQKADHTNTSALQQEEEEENEEKEEEDVPTAGASSEAVLWGQLGGPSDPTLYFGSPWLDAAIEHELDNVASEAAEAEAEAEAAAQAAQAATVVEAEAVAGAGAEAGAARPALLSDGIDIADSADNSGAAGAAAQ